MISASHRCAKRPFESIGFAKSLENRAGRNRIATLAYGPLPDPLIPERAGARVIAHPWIAWQAAPTETYAIQSGGTWSGLTCLLVSPFLSAVDRVALPARAVSTLAAAITVLAIAVTGQGMITRNLSVSLLLPARQAETAVQRQWMPGTCTVLPPAEVHCLRRHGLSSDSSALLPLFHCRRRVGTPTAAKAALGDVDPASPVNVERQPSALPSVRASVSIGNNSSRWRACRPDIQPVTRVLRRVLPAKLFLERNETNDACNWLPGLAPCIKKQR